MLLVINVLFWLFALIWLIRLIKTLISRSRTVKGIRKVCDKMGYKCEITRSPFASFFCTSEHPDMFIRTPEKYYYIRIISALGRRHFYFAGEGYCTHMKKAPILMLGSKRAMRSGNAVQDYMNFDEKFRMYPEPRLPKNARENVGYVMLFNPAPAEIHVAEGRRSEVIGSGGRIGRFSVYDRKQFCNMLEYGEVKRTFRFGE